MHKWRCRTSISRCWVTWWMKHMNRDYEIVGLPGWVGSMDVVHLKWASCPMGNHNCAKGKEGFLSLISVHCWLQLIHWCWFMDVSLVLIVTVIWGQFWFVPMFRWTKQLSKNIFQQTILRVHARCWMYVHWVMASNIEILSPVRRSSSLAAATMFFIDMIKRNNMRVGCGYLIQ